MNTLSFGQRQLFCESRKHCDKKMPEQGSSNGPEVQRIYSAEQIAVPPALPGILKAWTKEVIRNNPSNIYNFSAMWFQQRLAEANKASGSD